MTFELTDSLMDKILYYMENQDDVWLVNANDSTVVGSSGLDDDLDAERSDSGIYYAIPEWSSDDGFQMLRDFTNNLHSPLAREDLKRALNGGRGVFRRFKDAVKSYPEVERKFYAFKDGRMKARVKEWYNALRESWGIEKLASTEGEDSDDTEELVLDDFIFRAYDSAKDRNDIALGSALVAEEYRRQYSLELGEAVAEMWQRLSAYSFPEAKFGFVCRSQQEEFLGCLLVSFCPSSSKTSVLLTDFFVVQNYRGLGIGEELLSKCLFLLKNQGVQWFLISNTIISDEMDTLLGRIGFCKLGSGYLADLTKLFF